MEPSTPKALILSAPNTVRLSTNEMVCRISRGRASILRKTAWGQVNVAIEEIGVEVVDDLLHGPSGRGGGSVSTTESGRLGLEVGGVCMFNPASAA
ncbi:unnamed protein product [Heligmosomoides polygyrus]|uniref:dUTPase domain-containing protein n=1 Tax=Heligmosomoides polygyrus TaxID=6339 RepID=A0A183GTJ9_HELPZ|nr:unnamed protein product [Heligmosomoides polygyrus]